VSIYWKNWQPRFGIAYAINDKTVVSAGYATVYSRAVQAARAAPTTVRGSLALPARRIIQTMQPAPMPVRRSI
jgi:hypothetical protein